MYNDIITYQLAEGVSEEKLFSIAERIITDWMRNQAGFIKWEINKAADNTYKDIVYWESEADAKAAEKAMVSIPNASEWFACYKEGSISSQGMTRLKSFS